MITKPNTQNPLENAVPPVSQQGPFTGRYARNTWGATTHIVHTKSGEVRAYVSDYTLGSSVTLQDIARKSSRIKNDMSPWISYVRLKQWSDANAMHLRVWRQASDNTVEVIA